MTSTNDAEVMLSALGKESYGLKLNGSKMD